MSLLENISTHTHTHREFFPTALGIPIKLHSFLKNLWPVKYLKENNFQFDFAWTEIFKDNNRAE